MMDPYSLLKVLWRFRLLALPAIALVLLAGAGVFLFGPRTYESSAVYVIVNPNVPTDRELQDDSRLAKLNSDNPYLRASDPSLIVKVVSSRMSSQATALAAQAQGLGTEFTVAQSALSTMTLVITASGPTPDQATNTRQWLLTDLKKELYDLQKVNGADDRYLFSALPVDVGVEPVEKKSSRLRSLILVLAAGVVLVIGVVSLGVANERRRADREVAASEAPAESTRTTQQPASAKGSTDSTASGDDPPSWTG